MYAVCFSRCGIVHTWHGGATDKHQMQSSQHLAFIISQKLAISLKLWTQWWGSLSWRWLFEQQWWFIPWNTVPQLDLTSRVQVNRESTQLWELHNRTICIATTTDSLSGRNGQTLTQTGNIYILFGSREQHFITFNVHSCITGNSHAWVSVSVAGKGGSVSDLHKLFLSWSIFCLSVCLSERQKQTDCLSLSLCLSVSLSLAHSGEAHCFSMSNGRRTNRQLIQNNEITTEWMRKKKRTSTAGRKTPETLEYWGVSEFW